MGRLTNWIRYQGALIPKAPPHEKFEISKLSAAFDVIRSGSALARWTTGWNLDHETNFWFLVKDHFQPINELPSKIRWEINKGRGAFEASNISLDEFIEFAYEVYVDCFFDYETHISQLDKNEFYRSVVKNPGDHYSHDYWGVRQIESGRFIGYAIVKKYQDSADYSSVKIPRAFLTKYAGYSLFYELNKFYLSDLRLKYVTDGSRNISHQTSIQDHLEKKHGFRKCYVNIHVVLHPLIYVVVKILSPLNGIIRKSEKKLFKKIMVAINLDKLSKGLDIC